MEKRKVKLMLSSKIVLGIIIFIYSISEIIFSVPLMIYKHSIASRVLLNDVQDVGVKIFWVAQLITFIAAAIAAIQNISINKKLKKLSNGEIKDLDKNDLEKQASQKKKAAKIYLYIWIFSVIVLLALPYATVPLQDYYPVEPALPTVGIRLG